MDGELVLGSRISVRYHREKGNSVNKSQGYSETRNRAVSESEIATSSPKQMYNASASLAGARTLQIPHYQSPSPVIGAYNVWGNYCTPNNAPPGIIQPPPVFIPRPYTNNTDISFNRTRNELVRVQSPIIWQVSGPQQFSHLWKEQYKAEKAKALGKRVHIPQVRDNNIGNASSHIPDGVRRIRGTHGSFVHPVEWNGARPSCRSLSVPPNYNGNVHFQTCSVKRRSPSPMCDTQKKDQNQWNGQNQQPVSVRNTKPSISYKNAAIQGVSQQNNHTSYYPSDTESEEVEKFFNPINNRNGSSSSNGTYTPIELQVTNLDQNIDPQEMKRILYSVFMEHVAVLHISVFMQSDNNFAASVKVPSLPDAQYAISQLHRRKIGYKRILISYAHTGGPNPQLIRAQIVMLLQEVPGHKLPLFKFREMYESRFMISISVSELHKMKDVCIITEDPGGRMVSLNPHHRNTPSPCFNNTTQEGQLEFPFCTIHTRKPWSDKGWAEQEMASLPNVKISLKILGPRIHQLLITHDGGLPLPSLPNCYEIEFKEKLPVIESGVPLEHLLSCLPSIELRQGVGSVKYIVWSENKTQDNSHEENKCVSPPLANQLALFTRELVDLLKTAPHCQVPFKRFIPAYHHHFGRQCRVADYGFTKLIDLLEALTHTVQVIGEGNKRIVTLSHRAQVRRFTSDLLRVLKSKSSKQVALSEFPSVYTRVIVKPWDIVDYGVCDIEDILDEVSKNTVIVTTVNGDKMIAIPKREQTPEEIERTKQFAVEVVELLQHAPQCRMLFNKFVPSYHHHFGHQCRVSDYGFTKLIELFEAIPHVVKIEDVNDGERQICLTEKEGLQVLTEQISKLVSRTKEGLSISSIGQTFLRQFGYALRPELFGCNSMLQLMKKLNDTVKIVDLTTGPAIITIDKSHLQQLSLQCRRVLMDQPQYKMAIKEFQQAHAQYYSKPSNMEELKKDLSNVVQFTTEHGERFIELTPLYCFACNLYRVMMNYGGILNLSQFEGAYLAVIGSACRTAHYGFPTLSALLQALPCTVIIKDIQHKKKVIYLNKKLAAAGIPLPPTFTPSSSCQETDNNNESFENNSSNVNTSHGSVVEEHKWTEQVNDSDDSGWSQKEDNNSWLKENDKQWKTSSSEKQPHKWSSSEDDRENFLKNLMHSPSMRYNFLPPPPKPDSPPEEDTSKDQWKFLVWINTAKQSSTSDEDCTNVQIPPLNLPSCEQMTYIDSKFHLLSPAKGLLPATANPLSPQAPLYFPTKHNLVVAPHPSELPLPSLSLTPKKHLSSENNVCKQSIADKEKSLNSSLKNNVTTPENDSNNMASNENDEIQDTPTKTLFTGKRRLAAQFNQLIES